MNIFLKRPFELPPRLELLSAWIPPGAAFADVGTDHAMLPVWLMLHQRVKSCIATDLRPEPLRRACRTAARYGVQEISFRLCDGLSGIDPSEADTITIAGLGGETIAEILHRTAWTADGQHTFLLQPVTRAEYLRRYLSEHGFVILREGLALERDTLYPAMEVTAGTMHLTPGQWYGGVKLLHDPLGNRCLIEQILRLQYAVAGLSRARDPQRRRQADELRDAVTELLQMREQWRQVNAPQTSLSRTVP